MAWTDELESRVQALTELANNLQDRLARAEGGLKEQRELVAEIRAQLLPLKSQIGFVEGRLDGKKETTSLLITAFLSGLSVLISAMLGFLNLSGRL